MGRWVLCLVSAAIGVGRATADAQLPAPLAPAATADEARAYLRSLDACCAAGDARCQYEAAVQYLLPEASPAALQSENAKLKEQMFNLPHSAEDAATMLAGAMEGGSAEALTFGALMISAGLATVKEVDQTLWPAASCFDENSDIDVRRNFTTSWISEKMLYYVVENGHSLLDTDDNHGHSVAVLAYASLASSRAVGASEIAAAAPNSERKAQLEELSEFWCGQASALFTEIAAKTIDEIQDTAIDEFLPPVRVSLALKKAACQHWQWGKILRPLSTSVSSRRNRCLRCRC